MQNCATYIYIFRVTDAYSAYKGGEILNHPLTLYILLFRTSGVRINRLLANSELMEEYHKALKG